MSNATFNLRLFFVLLFWATVFVVAAVTVDFIRQGLPLQGWVEKQLRTAQWPAGVAL